MNGRRTIVQQVPHGAKDVELREVPVQKRQPDPCEILEPGLDLLQEPSLHFRSGRKETVALNDFRQDALVDDERQDFLGNGSGIFRAFGFQHHQSRPEASAGPVQQIV